MGLASIRNRVRRIERSLRAPVTATDAAAARAKMLSLLTLLANDERVWADWIALSGGGAAVDMTLAGRIAARINAASTAETVAGRADPCALRVGSRR